VTHMVRDHVVFIYVTTCFYILDGIHTEHGGYEKALDSPRDEHAGFQAKLGPGSKRHL
jgi:hypothetical protein